MNFMNRRSPAGRRQRRELLAGVALVLVLMAASCGKKGPLYLPDDAAPPTTAGEPAPAQPAK